MSKKDVNGRIGKRFAVLKDRGEKALIAFITAGDPDIKSSEEIIMEIAKAGADIIELGVPFSDPMADGPTIQESSERALKGGVQLPDVLKLVKRLRKETEIPIVLFGYYNPVFVYGLSRFAEDAARAGVDGVLIVDLPPEEAGELSKELKANGLDLVFTLTPTSDAGRMKLVSETSSGFIYYVSVTGVTGARSKVGARIRESVREVRKYSSLPVAVGFGISSEEQVRDVSKHSDGVIVGSAIVNVIKKNLKDKGLPRKVGRFVSSLKRGTVGK